jgi:hypothetical protein
LASAGSPVVVLVTIPLAWLVEQIIERNDLTTGVEVATRERLGDQSGYEVRDGDASPPHGE